MFKQINAPDHVLAIQLSDKLSGDDVKKYKQLFDDKLEKHSRMGALVDITGLSDMSTDALAPGIKADLDFLRHIGQFNRIGFVTDKEWPGVIIGMANSLFAGLESKQFKPEQRKEALEWVAEIPVDVKEKNKPARQSIRIVPTSKDDVLAFEIDGVITSDGMSAVLKDVKAFLDRHEKVSMLGRIRHLGGIDPTVFMQSGLLSMKLAAMKKVERYAIVGAPGWMNTAVKALDPVMTDIEMRTFTSEQEAEAWVWVGASPGK